MHCTVFSCFYLKVRLSGSFRTGGTPCWLTSKLTFFNILIFIPHPILVILNFIKYQYRLLQIYISSQPLYCHGWPFYYPCLSLYCPGWTLYCLHMAGLIFSYAWKIVYEKRWFFSIWLKSWNRPWLNSDIKSGCLT